MKSVTCAALAGLFLLGGCVSWNRPYIDDSASCGNIVDAKERLDCYDRAERAERDWREEKRREAEDREVPEADED